MFTLLINLEPIYSKENKESIAENLRQDANEAMILEILPKINMYALDGQARPSTFLDVRITQKSPCISVH